MAHNIEIRDGEGSFVTAGGRQNIPWHNLGKVIDKDRLTIQEAIVACKANYDVGIDNLIRVTAEDVERIKNGLPLDRLITKKDLIKSHNCTVRRDLDEVLGVVGNKYEVVQNMEGFEFVQDILNGVSGNSNIPFIETAGVLGNGERMFVTAKFKEPFKIKGSNDTIEDYILFTNSHDGTGAVIAQFTTIRVVCNNTLNIALNETRNKVRFMHTKNVHSQINLKERENAQKALSILKGHQVYVENLKETLDRFADVKVDDKIIKRIVGSVFLEQEQLKQLQLENYSLNNIDISTTTKNKFENMLSVIDNGIGQENWRGSGLWVLNGVTTYFQNHSNYKNNTVKLDSLMEGNANKKMQKAYDSIYALAA